MMVYHDPQADFGKGDIYVKAIDPLDIYVCPSSQDAYSRDASNIIVARLYSEMQLISMYPDLEEIIKSATTTSVAPQTESIRHGLEDQIVSKEDINAQRIYGTPDERQLEVIERFSKIKVPHYRIYDPQLNDEKILTQQNTNNTHRRLDIKYLIKKEKIS